MKAMKLKAKRTPIKQGDRFTRLVVAGESVRKGKGIFWPCLCDCGSSVIIYTSSLNSGATKSCGCLHREISSAQARGQKTTHGYYGSPTYVAWQAMKRRGTGKEHRKNYSDRGITMCDRWLTFENFLADMGERPTGLTLDRIDNSKGYYRENCRWADWNTQARNRRNNRFIEFNGGIMTIAALAERCGMSYPTLLGRLNKGMSAHEAVTKHVQKRVKRC